MNRHRESKPLNIQVLDVAKNGETYALEVGKLNAFDYINSVFLELGFTKRKNGCWERYFSDKTPIFFYTISHDKEYISLSYRGEYNRKDLLSDYFSVSLEDFNTETDASFLGEEILDKVRDYLDWINEKIEADNKLLKEKQNESQEQ